VLARRRVSANAKSAWRRSRAAVGRRFGIGRRGVSLSAIPAARSSRVRPLPSVGRASPAEEETMSATVPAIQVGQLVPDFKLTTYDPKTGDFGTFDLAEQKKAGKWSVLFFYPADFTFV